MTTPSDQPQDGDPYDAEPRRKGDPTPLVIGLIALAVVVHELQWVLLPFVVSSLVAYICTPLIERVKATLRKPRWVAAVVVFCLILLLLVLAGFFIGRPLLRELVHAITEVQPLLEGFAQAVLKGRSINVFGQSMNAQQLAQAGVAGLREWIGDTARLAMIGSGAVAALFGGFVSLVLLFYFLLNGPDILRGALWLAPAGRRPLLREILRRLDPLLKRYFIGVVITVTYASIAAYLGLGLVLRIKHALVLALVTGVFEIIPVFGPAASALLAGVAALRAAKGIGLIIGYAIYAVALRLAIDQFIGPIALGTAARMNPALIIFCFFAGGVLFGVIGIILAIPTALTVRVTLSVLRGESGGPMPRRAK